jgi:hypothetical protein
MWVLRSLAFVFRELRTYRGNNRSVFAFYDIAGAVIAVVGLLALFVLLIWKLGEWIGL